MRVVQATTRDFDGIVVLHRKYHTEFIVQEDRGLTGL